MLRTRGYGMAIAPYVSRTRGCGRAARSHATDRDSANPDVGRQLRDTSLQSVLAARLMLLGLLDLGVSDPHGQLQLAVFALEHAIGELREIIAALGAS
jgi:hypothetical protein